MRKMLKEFREFAVKGSVVDLAVGVIIGAAFGKIIASLVSDVLMPLVGKFTGGADFSNKFLTLGPGSFPTVEAAKAAGVPTLNYGIFINNIIHFIIVAFCVFAIVKAINFAKRKEAEEPKAPPTPTREEKLLEEIRDLLKTRA